jgi:ubiquinone/menaquinone biosynthesis C-methylase UbiE
VDQSNPVRETTRLIVSGRDREAALHGAVAPATKGPAMTMILSVEEIDAIKQKQQATWSSGNYGVIGTRLQIMGERLCEAADLQSGRRVLDVAAGNGNASLAAARRGCEVVATDYVPELLAQAAARAAAEGLELTTEVADAEDLPYADGSFDYVLSTVGVMFAPNPPKGAAEMLRVARPGGKIGLASWTPSGFVGQMFKVVGAHVPPPAGITSPVKWGDADFLQDLFGAEADLEATTQSYAFRFRSAEELFEVFKDFYGPTVKAWAALDDAGKQSFKDDLVALAVDANRSAEGGLVIESEYLEVVATKR